MASSDRLVVAKALEELNIDVEALAWYEGGAAKARQCAARSSLHGPSCAGGQPGIAGSRDKVQGQQGRRPHASLGCVAVFVALSETCAREVMPIARMSPAEPDEDPSRLLRLRDEPCVIDLRGITKKQDPVAGRPCAQYMGVRL